MSDWTPSEPELQDSHLRVKELIARHAHAVDRRDAEAFVALWHPDAVYVTGGTTHTGVAAITAATTGMWVDGSRTWHFPTNTVIGLTAPDAATALSTFAAIGTPAEAPAKYFLGTYSDAFEKRDGVWRFVRREVEVVHIGDA